VPGTKGRYNARYNVASMEAPNSGVGLRKGVREDLRALVGNREEKRRLQTHIMLAPR